MALTVRSLGCALVNLALLLDGVHAKVDASRPQMGWNR